MAARERWAEMGLGDMAQGRGQGEIQREVSVERGKGC